MVLIQCSHDRWQAHREIAAQFSGETSRDHLWRFVGEGEAKVRTTSDELEVPDPGAAISFRIDCVPVVKSRGKRKQVAMTEAFAAAWFMDRIGTAIEVTQVAARPMLYTIRKDGLPAFTRSSARVLGRGRVLDAEKLEHIMRHGLGEAKAYGFGMLEIERTQ